MLFSCKALIHLKFTCKLFCWLVVFFILFNQISLFMMKLNVKTGWQSPLLLLHVVYISLITYQYGLKFSERDAKQPTNRHFIQNIHLYQLVYFNFISVVSIYISEVSKHFIQNIHHSFIFMVSIYISNASF